MLEWKLYFEIYSPIRAGLWLYLWSKTAKSDSTRWKWEKQRKKRRKEERKQSEVLREDKDLGSAQLFMKCIPTRTERRQKRRNKGCFCRDASAVQVSVWSRQVSPAGRRSVNRAGDTGAECSGAEWISSGVDHTHGFTPPPPPPLSRLILWWAADEPWTSTCRRFSHKTLKLHQIHN